jgi:hypothetical protein
LLLRILLLSPLGGVHLRQRFVVWYNLIARQPKSLSHFPKDHTATLDTDNMSVHRVRGSLQKFHLALSLRFFLNGNLNSIDANLLFPSEQPGRICEHDQIDKLQERRLHDVVIDVS